MAKSSLIIILSLCIAISFVDAEIHRAKTHKSNTYGHRFGARKLPKYVNNEYVIENEIDSTKTYQASVLNDVHNKVMNNVYFGYHTEIWLYSIFSAVLVGLSGIFPLLIIPLEIGSSIKFKGL